LCGVPRDSVTTVFILLDLMKSFSARHARCLTQWGIPPVGVTPPPSTTKYFRRRYLMGSSKYVL